MNRGVQRTPLFNNIQLSTLNFQLTRGRTGFDGGSEAG